MKMQTMIPCCNACIVLQFLGVESSYTYIAQGLVIIIAVALDLRKYLAKK